MLKASGWVPNLGDQKVMSREQTAGYLSAVGGGLSLVQGVVWVRDLTISEGDSKGREEYVPILI